LVWRWSHLIGYSYIVLINILTANIKLGNMQYLILKILLILYFTGLFKYETAVVQDHRL
jgi:hypothetical protein